MDENEASSPRPLTNERGVRGSWSPTHVLSCLVSLQHSRFGRFSRTRAPHTSPSQLHLYQTQRENTFILSYGRCTWLQSHASTTWKPIG